MIDATKVHLTVIQLIIDLWELGFPKHDCFGASCRHEYKQNEIFPTIIERIDYAPLPAETLAGIVNALQKAGFSLEEIRELLKVRMLDDIPNDDDMVNGRFNVIGCVGPLSLVDALCERHPLGQ